MLTLLEMSRNLKDRSDGQLLKSPSKSPKLA